ncbi:MAG: hypothetical protein ACR2QW_18735, partial [bacterium]
MKLFKETPGVVQSMGSTDLPVMYPLNLGTAGRPNELLFSRWLGGFSMRSILVLLVVALMWPLVTLAQSNYTSAQAFEALGRWLPFLVTKGFALNILISFMTMLIGTIAGVLL